MLIICCAVKNTISMYVHIQCLWWKWVWMLSAERKRKKNIHTTVQMFVLISRDHTHLSHSFIIHAFSLKLLKYLSKCMVFLTPHSPHVYSEEHSTFVYQVVHCLMSPHPCIPFSGANFETHIGCQLLTLT